MPDIYDQIASSITPPPTPSPSPTALPSPEPDIYDQVAKSVAPKPPQPLAIPTPPPKVEDIYSKLARKAAEEKAAKVEAPLLRHVRKGVEYGWGGYGEEESKQEKSQLEDYRKVHPVKSFAAETVGSAINPAFALINMATAGMGKAIPYLNKPGILPAATKAAANVGTTAAAMGGAELAESGDPESAKRAMKSSALVQSAFEALPLGRSVKNAFKKEPPPLTIPSAPPVRPPDVSRSGVSEYLKRTDIADQPKIPQLDLHAAGPFPKKEGHVNLQTIGTPDEVTGMIQQMARANMPEMEAAKRGKQSIEQIQQNALKSGLTLDDLEARKMGSVYNAEEVVAAGNLVNEASRQTYDLVKESLASGDVNKGRAALMRWYGVFKSATAAKSEAGRALRAAQIVSTGEVPHTNFLKKVFKTAGTPETWDEDVMRRLSAIDPEDPVAMTNFLRDVSKSGTKDKIFEAWINWGLLSGPKTHIVNTVSNAVTALSHSLVEKPQAAAIESLKLLKPGAKREVFFGEVPHEIMGQAVGLMQGLKSAYKAFKTEIPQFGMDKFETGHIPAIKGTLGKATRLPGRLLMAEDEVFKSVNYSGSIYAQAYAAAAKEGLKGKALFNRTAELIKAPSKEMRAKAGEDAVYRTFQKKTGPYAQKVMALRSIPTVRYVMPFVKTPVNIAKYGLERTPLNIPRVAYKLAKGEFKGPQAAEELAKLTTGMAVAGGVMALAAEGKITGAPPKDAEERAVWMAQGMRPYSIKIGDTWYQYGRVEPLGMTFGLIADLKGAFDFVESEDAALQLASLVGRNLISKSYVSGLANAMDAIQDPKRYGKKWTSGLAGTAIPNLLAQFTRAEEGKSYKPKSPLQAMKMRIPYIDKKDIPVFRTIWGKPEIAEWGLPERLLSPVQRPTETQDPATKEIYRLKFQPGTPRNRIGKTKLTDAEYDRYVELAGQYAHEEVTKLIQKPAWIQETDDGKKEDTLQRLFKQTRDRAKHDLLRSLPELRGRIKDQKRAEHLGATEVE